MTEDTAGGASAPEGTDGDMASLGDLVREFYFPTPIYYRDLPDAPSLNADLLRLIRAERAADADGIERSNVAALGGWHSKTDLNLRPEYRAFCSRLIRTASEISDANGYHPGWELAIDNMWAIINPPGSFNRSHIHPGVLWSGVYYVAAPPENAGRIVFTDPRTANLMAAVRYAPDRQRSAENWSEVFFHPIPGRMLLFPSWLYHAVEANTAQAAGAASERVILSFNLYQRRRP